MSDDRSVCAVAFNSLQTKNTYLADNIMFGKKWSYLLNNVRICIKLTAMCTVNIKKIAGVPLDVAKKKENQKFTSKIILFAWKNIQQIFI